MTRHRIRLPLALLALASLHAGGCSILGFGGAMYESYDRTRIIDFPADYDGLAGKSFAVIVVADRASQLDFGYVVPEVTRRVTERLWDPQTADPTAFVPPYDKPSGVIRAEKLLPYLYANPRWVAMPRIELAQDLGVDRAIFIEIIEYRLHDAGNQYLWDAVAAANVTVYETDASFPDEPTFAQSIRVSFPDGDAYGPMDIDRSAVEQILLKRFIDRASWIFYTHKERKYPERGMERS